MRFAGAWARPPLRTSKPSSMLVISEGDFRQLKGEKHATGRSFTTPETIANERANVRHVMTGQNTVEPITDPGAGRSSGRNPKVSKRGTEDASSPMCSRPATAFTAFRGSQEPARRLFCQHP